MRVMNTGCAFFLAGAIVLASFGFARADPASPASTSVKQDASKPPPPNTANKKTDDQHPPDTPAVVVDDNNVQSLLGKDVTSAKGEKLGQITDILVSHTGEIRAAVIDFGGFLGVGSRKIAVAWPTLHFSENAITLGLTRDELRVTPEYHQGEPIVIVGAIALPSMRTPRTSTSSVPEQSPAAPTPAQVK